MKYKNETLQELESGCIERDKKYKKKVFITLSSVWVICFSTSCVIGSVIPILTMPVFFLMGAQKLAYDIRNGK